MEFQNKNKLSINYGWVDLKRIKKIVWFCENNLKEKKALCDRTEEELRCICIEQGQITGLCPRLAIAFKTEKDLIEDKLNEIAQSKTQN